MHDLNIIYSEMKKYGLDRVDHLGGSFMAHLIGTYQTLARWGERPEVCLGGLFHAVYSTEAFRLACLPFERRPEIVKLIGPEAEKLAYLFCAIVRDSLFTVQNDPTSPVIKNRITGKMEAITQLEHRALLAITLANNLELHPREPVWGKWTYKRNYISAQKMFSELAYQQFLRDYKVGENGLKKILVIGGTGALGTRLVHLLLADGYDVTILSRGLARDPFRNEVDRISVDRHDSKKFFDALSGREWHAVIDNLCLTASDAKAAANVFSNKVNLYLQTSSDLVYSPGNDQTEVMFNPEQYFWNDSEIDETFVSQKFARGQQRSKAMALFGESKRRAEAVIWREFKSSKNIIRFPTILAPDDPGKTLEKVVSKVLRGETVEISKWDSSRNYCEAWEAARFLLWMLQNKKNEIINYASHDHMSNQDMFLEIERVVNHKINIRFSEKPDESMIFCASSNTSLNLDKVKSWGLRTSEIRSWLPGFICRAADAYRLIEKKPKAS